MSKGGGGGGTQQQQPTRSTVTQSNLPEYVEPYFTQLLEDAQAAQAAVYTPYTGERVQGFDPLQTQGFTAAETAAAGIPAGMEAAQKYYGSLFGEGGGPDAFQATDYSALTDVFAPSETRYDPSTAYQDYMNPYIENVMDAQRSREERLFQRGLRDERTQAQRAGGQAAFGSRQALREEAQRAEMNRRLGEQEAGLRSQAYQTAQQQAQQQFDKQMQRQLQEAQLGLQAGQAGAAEALQEAQYGLTAAQQMAGLDPDLFKQQLAQADVLQQLGATQQQMDQTNLDLAYQDFINQRDYDKQMINFMSSILRGVPVSPQSEVIEYQPPPSFGGQLAGAGLGAAGLLKALG